VKATIEGGGCPCAEPSGPRKHHMDTSDIAQAMRWLARAWSLASIGLLLAFFVGEGVPPITFKSSMFPLGLMAGLLVAWRFERIGGLIALACLLAFYSLEYVGDGSLPKGSAFLLISAPGAIFLLSGYLRAKK